MKLPFLFIIFSLIISPAAINASDNQFLTVASFITSVEDQDQGVKTNLQIACRRLNGYIVMPKATFSFNNVVGEGSAKNGYINGRVLYREEARWEPGGGLCQVSTTLFNALLAAGFNIIERHRHLRPVSYAPLGLDATIYYGKKDLRLKNPFNQRFYIATNLTEKSLSIVVKAENQLPYRYELTTEEEETEIPILDKSKPIRQGVSIYVNRRRYSENSLLDSATLYKDYYPPVYIK